MKRYLLPLAAIVALSGSLLRAQDITGTWQGTLTPPGAPKELRIVLKVAKADDGKLKGTMYSIDQDGQSIPVGPVTLQSGVVKYAIAGFGSYEGKLNSDATLISGRWTQGADLPLDFKHVTEAAAWTIPPPPAKIEPMADSADPAFEVATIKPSKPDEPGKMLTVRGRQLITINLTLADLISFAYGVHAKQVTGGAPWMSTDKYDITALPDTPGMPNDKQIKGMLKKLLAERFQLTFHHDSKELSVYALTFAKSNPNLKKSEADPNDLPGLFFRGPGRMVIQNASLNEFANTMQSVVLDRPVVDQTGLPGKFDFALNWTPDESQFGGIRIPPPTDTADAPPGLFTAIQEQIGLKLDATHAAVDVLVIDRVEKPSEN